MLRSTVAEMYPGELHQARLAGRTCELADRAGASGEISVALELDVAGTHSP